MNYTERYIVEPGTKVSLSKRAPDDTGDVGSRKRAEAIVKKSLQRMAELQHRLYAEGKRSLLIVLQAMDAGGKDGTIRHVMGPLNPQSCKVTSFKAPTEEDLAHDFLWRIHRVTPRKGEIRIFNRPQSEDALIVRVHNLVPRRIWSKRYDQINDFEKLLADNQVHILKFFLHISKGEQLKRFRKRLDDPARHWKANPQDFAERKHWGDYMKAYRDALSRCSTSYAPWFVVPADKKWYRNLVVSQIVLETLRSLPMRYPKPAFDISKIKVE